MKKADMIKLFKAMEDNCWEIARTAQNPDLAIKNKAEALAFNCVINCMTNSKFAEDMAEIYLT